MFSFGGAIFHGSTGGVALAKPVVGMAATPDGGGYWLVASDGGIFAFGTAGYYGSVPGIPVTSPPPPSGGSCTASMSNPTPGDSGNDTVNVSSNVPNSPVTVTKHYKTTTSYDSGTTDGSGSVSITFDIGHPTVGYTVQVGVNVNNGQATCSTSFTPQ
jgi:hypothetical protein